MDKYQDKSEKREKLGDPENEEAWAHSAELINFGGMLFYIPWDI